MKLEEEIKQDKFDHEFHKLDVNLIYTSNWITGMHIQFFKPFGISPQQYNLMRILRGQYPNPATINLLIDRMLDKTSNASRLVDKLCLKNYVTRTVSATDKRRVDVLITNEGLELLKVIDTQVHTVYERFNTLQESEAILLNDLLNKLRN